MYNLMTQNIADDPWITIVGCGGTGGFVAESLCRLLTGSDAVVTLVDHDRVEPHNLLRQNFRREDVGRFKSVALAERLSKQFGRTIGYSTMPFRPYTSGTGYSARTALPGLPSHRSCLLIGCVDNAAARSAMAKCLPGSPRTWLIDAGNDTDYGQVLIGNIAERSAYGTSGAFDDDACSLLPAPTVQRPDLLTAVPTTPPDTDCAAALDLTNQDPTINQTMASLVITVVRRILAADCPFMALYADMRSGVVRPTYASPQAALRAAENSGNAELAELFRPYAEDIQGDPQ